MGVGWSGWRRPQTRAWLSAQSRGSYGNQFLRLPVLKALDAQRLVHTSELFGTKPFSANLWSSLLRCPRQCLSVGRALKPSFLPLGLTLREVLRKSLDASGPPSSHSNPAARNSNSRGVGGERSAIVKTGSTVLLRRVGLRPQPGGRIFRCDSCTTQPRGVLPLS